MPEATAESGLSDEANRRALEPSASSVPPALGSQSPPEGAAFVPPRVAIDEPPAPLQQDFERFFELVPDLVAIASQEGTFLRLNRAWEAGLGYQLPEMLGRRFIDFVHPDDVAATLDVFRNAKDGELISAFANRYRAKNGSYHWLEWSASPVSGDGRIYAVARDVTDWRSKEEQLSASESRFRGLFQNMVEGLAYCRMIYDEAGEPVDWIYLDVNDAFEKQTGLVGAKGRLVSDVIPGIRETDPILFANYSRVATTGEPMRFESYVEALQMWFDLRVYSPALGEFVAVFDVITERKWTEAAAAERENRLQALLDNAPYGAHMYDLAPDGRLIFTGYNATAAGMLGIDHDALIGKTLEEAFPGNVGTETPDAYRKVAREGGTWETTEYAYSDDHGIAGAFDVYAFSFGPNRVSVFFRDVTALKRTEMELAAKDQQLERTVLDLAGAVRTLRTLSACNEALVRASSEQRLLQDICDIAVTQGGYAMAWVGYMEHDEARTVRHVAKSGDPNGVLDALRVTWDDSESGSGVVGTAIRRRGPVVADDADSSPYFARWREEALTAGLRSSACFPLMHDDMQPFGAIVFFSSETAAFSTDELGMLGELASDLAYGIQTLQAREARQQMARDLTTANERLEDLLHEITSALGSVIEARDPYTSGHEARVAQIAKAIAIELGLSHEEVEATEMAGLVHDIGKVSVPAEILTKPGALSETEMELVRDHSRAGYEILKNIDFRWPIATIVLQHHERCDGSGYPAGLAGDEILLPARTLAVADTVEAMVSHRPYRPALGRVAALAALSERPGAYDPAVVRACLAIFERSDDPFTV
jgi:PAS domain S-box-containing protein/putative nucleotidyltransferase with HDIG domain